MDKKSKHQRYDAKRLQRLMINAVRDVDQTIIDQLDAIASLDGSKKIAIIKAIEERYKKVFKQNGWLAPVGQSD